MTELEQLRAEVADLRRTLHTLLPLAFTIAGSTQNSREATKELFEALRQAQQSTPGDTFWKISEVMLVGISGRAAMQFPDDETIQALHQQLRGQPQ